MEGYWLGVIDLDCAVRRHLHFVFELRVDFDTPELHIQAVELGGSHMKHHLVLVLRILLYWLFEEMDLGHLLSNDTERVNDLKLAPHTFLKLFALFILTFIEVVEIAISEFFEVLLLAQIQLGQTLEAPIFRELLLLVCSQVLLNLSEKRGRGLFRISSLFLGLDLTLICTDFTFNW